MQECLNNSSWTISYFTDDGWELADTLLSVVIQMNLTVLCYFLIHPCSHDDKHDQSRGCSRVQSKGCEIVSIVSP